jgi:hypothetical protein
MVSVEVVAAAENYTGVRYVRPVSLKGLTTPIPPPPSAPTGAALLGPLAVMGA